MSLGKVAFAWRRILKVVFEAVVVAVVIVVMIHGYTKPFRHESTARSSPLPRSDSFSSNSSSSYSSSRRRGGTRKTASRSSSPALQGYESQSKRRSTPSRPVVMNSSEPADNHLDREKADLLSHMSAFKDLVEMEREIDNELCERNHARMASSGEYVRLKHTLRVWLSSQLTSSSSSENRRWTFRITGELLPDTSSGAVHRDFDDVHFSYFIRSLFVEFDPLLCPDRPFVEWQNPVSHPSRQAKSFNSFQVSREAEPNCRCTVYLQLFHRPRVFRLERRLSRLLCLHTAPLCEIVRALWRYVSRNKLIDLKNHSVVLCDPVLKSVINCESFDFKDVFVCLQHLLLPPDPIILNYTICPEDPETPVIMCVDLDYYLCEGRGGRIVTPTSFMVSTRRTETEFFDSRMAKCWEHLCALNVSKRMLLDFSEDPQRLINRCVLNGLPDFEMERDGKGRVELDYWKSSAVYQNESVFSVGVQRLLEDELERQRQVLKALIYSCKTE